MSRSFLMLLAVVVCLTIVQVNPVVAQTLTVSRQIQLISHYFNPPAQPPAGPPQIGGVVDLFDFDMTGFSTTLADYNTYTFRLFAPAGQMIVVEPQSFTLFVETWMMAAGNNSTEYLEPVTISFENLTGNTSPITGVFGGTGLDQNKVPNGLGIGYYGSGSSAGPFMFTAISFTYTRSRIIPSASADFNIYGNVRCAYPTWSTTDPGPFVSLLPVPEPSGIICLVCGLISIGGAGRFLHRR